MSKYIKLENLKWHSPDESLAKPLIEFYITESDIADLPTIEVSEDAISRKAVGEMLMESWVDGFEYQGDLIRDLAKITSVVPKPKEGEWKFKKIFPNDDSEFPMGYLVCSVCGSQHANATPCNYCDNCGAKMKGADDE